MRQTLAVTLAAALLGGPLPRWAAAETLPSPVPELYLPAMALDGQRAQHPAEHHVDRQERRENQGERHEQRHEDHPSSVQPSAHETHEDQGRQGRRDTGSEVSRPQTPAVDRSEPRVVQEHPGRTPSTDPGRKPPTDPGRKPPTDPGRKPPTDPGRKPPTDPGRKPPTDPGRKPPTDPGRKPPTDPGRKPPTDPGRKPPTTPGRTPGQHGNPGTPVTTHPAPVPGQRPHVDPATRRAPPAEARLPVHRTTTPGGGATTAVPHVRPAPTGTREAIRSMQGSPTHIEHPRVDGNGRPLTKMGPHGLPTPTQTTIIHQQFHTTIINNNIVNIYNGGWGRGPGWHYGWGPYPIYHYWDSWHFLWVIIYIDDIPYCMRYHHGCYWRWDPFWGRWVCLDDGVWVYRDPGDLRPSVVVYNENNTYNYYNYNQTSGGSTSLTPDNTVPVEEQPGRTPPAESNTTYSADGARAVQIYGDDRSAFLQDTADPPAFKPIYLAKNVSKAHFTQENDVVVDLKDDKDDSLAYFSSDRKREVMIFADKKAYLYDMADPPAFEETWLGDNATGVRLKHAENGDLSEIVVLIGDSQDSHFTPDGYPINMVPAQEEPPQQTEPPQDSPESRLKASPAFQSLGEGTFRGL